MYGEELRKNEMVIDMEIEEILVEVAPLIKEEVRKEFGMKEALASDLQEARKIRSDLVQEYSKVVDDIESELFEEKLKLMKKIDTLLVKHRDMQEQLQDVSNVIQRLDSGDRVPTLKQLHIDDFSEGYLATGGEAPAVITKSEIRGLLGIHGARLPYAYILYAKHGVVERNESKALELLQELD